MKVLLDTCALSEVQRPEGSRAVKDLIAQIPDENLFLSALSVGEIAKGIELLPAGKKRTVLTLWLQEITTEFGERVLPIDGEIATTWGTVTARLQKAGITLPAVDGLIATTAMHFGLRLITRNTKHVEATGVLMLDPWQARNKD